MAYETVPITRPWPKRFKDPTRQHAYEVARELGNDNFSSFYTGKTTAGLGMGPHLPRTGAGHRCAYWDARNGKPSTYSEPSFAAYPFFKAGVDDRKAVDGKERGPTWAEFAKRRR